MDARDVQGLRQTLFNNGPSGPLMGPPEMLEQLAAEERADSAAERLGWPVETRTREELAELYPESKFRQPMAAAPKPFTSRIVEGRKPRTTSQHALWEHYQQAMAQASRECAANFLRRGIRVPSRETRRAIDAITRKCLRCGLLKREKKPEDPADG